MRAVLRKIGHFIRDHSGFLAATFGLVATYLASYVALIPPEKRLVPTWLAIFAGLCTLAFIASLIQQRAANDQAKLAAENEAQQTRMLENISIAVGATQAEAAEAAADNKRQLVVMQVKSVEESRPVVLIRYSADGDKDATALPTVENLGKSAATNIKIEDINVNGTRGPGTFEEIDALAPGEKRQVSFDAPDEGMMFRTYLIRYLENDLQHRPPINWDKPRELFTPLRMPLFVSYTDPATGRRYRSEHELEFTFSRHATVIFRKQEEI